MGSISTLIGGIAFVGFLIFLAGVGLVVVASSQGRSPRGGVMLAVFGLLAGVILSIVSQGILVIEPTQIGVVINVLTGELETPSRGPGTSIIIPGIQEVRIYQTEQQEYTMSGISSEGRVQGNDSIEVLTEDGQVVFVDITVIYRITRDAANTVHLNWQNRYEADFIRPTVRAITRDVVSQFKAEDIYGVSREAMGGEIEDRMRVSMLTEGLTLSNLLVRRIQFSDEFAASIELKQIADQEAQRAEILVAQQRQEAERIRVEAQGDRDATIARAEGEAQSIVLRAQAQAEALRLVSEQIAANPNLIQYQYVQNLSDNIGIALVPSNTPFLFDFNSFTELGSDFVAPPVSDADLPGLSDSTGNPDQ
jgi:regulator of protease activity HflC (stomatin/prohibitin superfamily)